MLQQLANLSHIYIRHKVNRRHSWCLQCSGPPTSSSARAFRQPAQLVDKLSHLLMLIYSQLYTNNSNHVASFIIFNHIVKHLADNKMYSTRTVVDEVQERISTSINIDTISDTLCFEHIQMQLQMHKQPVAARLFNP